MEVVTHENGDRFYTTPIGVLPSVTTVLSHVGDKKGLSEWRDRLGDYEADKVLRQARHRGNTVHSICEQYLLNKEWQTAPRLDLETFHQVKPFLDKHIQKIYGIEYPLWSKELQCAGRTDGMAMWDNTNVILDFKTVKYKNDNKNWHNKMMKYMLQTTVYAIAAEERQLASFSKSVIIVMVENDKPHIKIFNNLIFRDMAREIFINRP